MTTAIPETGTIRIRFDGGRPPALVTPRLSDTIAYSMIWRKRGWPSPQEDQLMVGTFAAFAACRRTGQFDGSFDEFIEQVLTLDPVDDDAENLPESDGSTPADPTSAGTDAPAPTPTPTGPAQGGIDPTPAPQTAPEPTLPTAAT